MVEEQQGRRSEPRKLWLVSTAAFFFVIAECAVLVLMVRRIGIELPLGWLGVSFVLSLAPAILVGFIVRTGVEWIRGTGRDYLRVVSRPQYVAMTLFLFVTLIAQVVFYASLKVMVPLLNERSFDALLWEIDSWLMFGLSPNVLLVNLLNNSVLLRFIDFGYGYFFFFSVLLSFPLFFPLRDSRLRISFVVANVVLWSCGAWLYLLFPSVGPAYSFHNVWDAFRHQFPVSTYWQRQLLDNYEMVLEMGRGVIDPNLNLVEGIGAFPSLHVGFQTLFALYVGNVSRLARAVTWFLVFLTFVGSIITGWHYMIDSVAGLALAVGIYFVMERIVLPAPGQDPGGDR